MASKLGIAMLSLLAMLLLVPENHAMIMEAPSPQPQATPGHLPPYGAREGSLKPQECGPRCTARCSKTAYKKPCMFFCQKCCARCLCVPPGSLLVGTVLSEAVAKTIVEELSAV
ncbi:hypothetical protein NL676_016977 [Syzygium grande]|nr:hypothetical protein NL676_016977 [Syzygium grande]